MGGSGVYARREESERRPSCIASLASAAETQQLRSPALSTLTTVLSVPRPESQNRDIAPRHLAFAEAVGHRPYCSRRHCISDSSSGFLVHDNPDLPTDRVRWCEANLEPPQCHTPSLISKTLHRAAVVART